AELVAHPGPHRAGDRGGLAEEPGGSGDVRERLVDRDPLDVRRVVAQHVDGGVAQTLVFAEMPADERDPGTERPRPPSGHAAAHAESAGLVGRREHHAAADRDRLSAQGRIEQLLDRSVEGVQVRMRDRGGLHGKARAPSAEHKENKRGALSSYASASALAGGAAPQPTGACEWTNPLVAHAFEREPTAELAKDAKSIISVNEPLRVFCELCGDTELAFGGRRRPPSACRQLPP